MSIQPDILLPQNPPPVPVSVPGEYVVKVYFKGGKKPAEIKNFRTGTEHANKGWPEARKWAAEKSLSLFYEDTYHRAVEAWVEFRGEETMRPVVAVEIAPADYRVAVSVAGEETWARSGFFCESLIQEHLLGRLPMEVCYAMDSGKGVSSVAVNLTARMGGEAIHHLPNARFSAMIADAAAKVEASNELFRNPLGRPDAHSRTPEIWDFPFDIRAGS